MSEAPKRWTVREERYLADKAKEHLNADGKVHWERIAAAMGRSEADCRDRWHRLPRKAR